jgi:hypothetical protein
MERKQWLQFSLHAALVVFGLALETFYPAVKVVICNPAAPGFNHSILATEKELALRFNIQPATGLILESFERKYSPFEGWGDYPEPVYKRTGIV